MSKVAELRKMWEAVQKPQNTAPGKNKTTNSPTPMPKSNPKPQPQQEVKLNFNDAKKLFQDKIQTAQKQSPTLKNTNILKKAPPHENVPKPIIPSIEQTQQVPKLSVSQARKLFQQRLQTAKRQQIKIKPLSNKYLPPPKQTKPTPQHSSTSHNQPTSIPSNQPPSEKQEKKKSNFESIREQMEKQSKEKTIHLLSNPQFNQQYTPATKPQHQHIPNIQQTQIEEVETIETPTNFQTKKANLQHILKKKSEKEHVEQTITNTTTKQQFDREEGKIKKIAKTIKQFDDSD